MAVKELRKSRAVLPMGTVMKLTSLTSRQIRYYDDNGLVNSTKTESNRRLYSLNDVNRIIDVHNYLDEGMTISDIKRVFEKQEARRKSKGKSLSDEQARAYLKNDMLNAGRFFE